MKSQIVKLAAAAAIIIVVLIGVSQLGNGTVTFAQVVEPILNARTVAFDFLVGGEGAGPVMHDIVVGSKIRRTVSNTDTIMVIDLDSAKLLTLDPSSKAAAYMDIDGPIRDATGNILDLVRNSVNSIKGVPIEELGRQNIDGYKAIGFRASTPNVELTIWGESDTAKPIRIELRLGQSLYVVRNIEFDVPVDDSLVSMEPPAGYTLSDKVLDLSQFSEQDFVTVLRLWAEHLLGGGFPQSLSVAELMSLPPPTGRENRPTEHFRGRKDAAWYDHGTRILVLSAARF